MSIIKSYLKMSFVFVALTCSFFVNSSVKNDNSRMPKSAEEKRIQVQSIIAGIVLKKETIPQLQFVKLYTQFAQEHNEMIDDIHNSFTTLLKKNKFTFNLNRPADFVAFLTHVRDYSFLKKLLGDDLRFLLSFLKAFKNELLKHQNSKENTEPIMASATAACKSAPMDEGVGSQSRGQKKHYKPSSRAQQATMLNQSQSVASSASAASDGQSMEIIKERSETPAISFDEFTIFDQMKSLFDKLFSLAHDKIPEIINILDKTQFERGAFELMKTNFEQLKMNLDLYRTTLNEYQKLVKDYPDVARVNALKPAAHTIIFEFEDSKPKKLPKKLVVETNSSFQDWAEESGGFDHLLLEFNNKIALINQMRDIALKDKIGSSLSTISQVLLQLVNNPGNLIIENESYPLDVGFQKTVEMFEHIGSYLYTLINMGRKRMALDLNESVLSVFNRFMGFYKSSTALYSFMQKKLSAKDFDALNKKLSFIAHSFNAWQKELEYIKK